MVHDKLKSVFKIKILKYFVVLLTISLVANFKLCLFNCNLTKTIELDYSISNVTVNSLDYLFDNKAEMKIVDLMDYGNISAFEALKVHLNPKDYCFVSVQLEITNNTQKDAYDWDYCIYKKGTLYYAVSVYEQDSPLFSPLLVGEQSGDVISFIIPRKLMGIDINDDQTISKELSPTSLENFIIKIRAGNLQNDINYKDFYQERQGTVSVKT